MSATLSTLIRATGVWVAYGRIEALRGINLQVGRGECVAVVGANGAGKTTLLRALSGMVPVRQGSAEANGQAVRFAHSHALARNGMLHIPEGRGTLRTLSVLDNLRIAFDVRPSPRPFEEAMREVFGQFPHLEQRQRQLAGDLSGGEQQMLALARAIVNRPQILLLDEPSLGLSPLMVSEAYRALRALRDEGMTILVVEQNVRLALQLAGRAYVLRQGTVVREGTSAELLADTDFTSHYLGTH